MCEKNFISPMDADCLDYLMTVPHVKFRNDEDIKKGYQKLYNLEEKFLGKLLITEEEFKFCNENDYDYKIFHNSRMRILEEFKELLSNPSFNMDINVIMDPLELYDCPKCHSGNVTLDYTSMICCDCGYEGSSSLFKVYDLGVHFKCQKCNERLPIPFSRYEDSISINCEKCRIHYTLKDVKRDGRIRFIK